MQAFLKRLRESNDARLWWRIRALTTLPGLLLILFRVSLSEMPGRILWALAVVVFGIGLFGETILQVLWAYDEDRRKDKAADEVALGENDVEAENAALDNQEELQKLD